MLLISVRRPRRNFVVKFAAALLQVSSYWSAVVLRAKLAHPGDEVGPNKWTVIRNSTGSGVPHRPLLGETCLGCHT